MDPNLRKKFIEEVEREDVADIVDYLIEKRTKEKVKIVDDKVLSMYLEKYSNLIENVSDKKFSEILTDKINKRVDYFRKFSNYSGELNYFLTKYNEQSNEHVLVRFKENSFLIERWLRGVHNRKIYDEACFMKEEIETIIQAAKD